MEDDGPAAQRVALSNHQGLARHVGPCQSLHQAHHATCTIQQTAPLVIESAAHMKEVLGMITRCDDQGLARHAEPCESLHQAHFAAWAIQQTPPLVIE